MSAGDDQEQAEATRLDPAAFGPPRYPGDKRPPFAPGNQVGVQFDEGNQASLRHGAWSERRIAPVARELLDGLLEQAAADPQFGHLKRPVFRPALRAWARCEARIELISTWLEAKAADGTPGDIDADGEVRSAAELLRRLDQQALKHRAQLAIDPASFGRLRRDAGSALVSFDLAELLAGLESSGPGRGPDREANADDGQ